MESIEKWYTRFNDEEFTRYYTSGEAIAVHIVRDLAFDINTSNKWIDVVSFNTYATNLNKDGVNWIIVELFPRITHPQYVKYDTEYNRYICWHAAHDDIAAHREKNHHGEKYIVLCKLVKIKTDDKNDYDYKVTAFSKIKQKKINYIIDNTPELVEKIRKNRKPTLSLLTVRE